MKIVRPQLFSICAFLLLAGIAACTALPAIPTPTPIPPTATPTPAPIPALDAQRTLKVGTMQRTYFIHIPAGLTDQQSVPLVLVFHGYQENGAYARAYTGFDAIANNHAFVVAYADGSGTPGSLSWNASGCCGEALLNNVDEPAFVRAMLADIQTLVPVDPRRIYATGFSNGALLSYRLACEMSETFAAVAPVSGVLLYKPCRRQVPVSLVHVHGTKDTVVPMDGGGSGIQFPAVKESISKWIELDDCSGAEQVEHNGLVTHITYGTCATGISVELYTVDGIGHSWPSKYVVPISEIIWEFFAAHPKP